MRQSIQEWTSKICERQPLQNLKRYGLLSRPYPFKFFKGCLPQILLGLLLNTLYQIISGLPDLHLFLPDSVETQFPIKKPN